MENNLPKENLQPPKASSQKPLPETASITRSPKSSSGAGDGLLPYHFIGLVAGALLLITVVVFSVICIRKRRKSQPNDKMQHYADRSHSRRHKDETDPHSPLMANGGEMSSNLSGRHHLHIPPSPNLPLGFNSTFTYDELEAATNGFSQANLIGQGGFGYVFKGVLSNDKIVAVKSLKWGSTQGDREFQAEVDIISRVHHRHLVSLVGYCIDGEQRMLVYEFVPNKTLDFHLHVNGGTTLDWSKRLLVAIGSAKGLAYLHEDCHPRIIHRDIKASNILLDNNFEAMVADFGLAKLTADTHVSTRVMGTMGYLAPEYASSGQLTEKSDVFSYGVMLVELITGLKAVHMGENLTDWARPILVKVLENNNYDELVDQHLRNEYNHHEMACMITCASASIRETARKRPKMSQIVRVLEGDLAMEVLNEDRSETPVET